jgi:hypothetical protein
LASQRQDLLNDDEEEEMALRVLIDNLGTENEVQERRSHGGSRPGKREKTQCICLTFSDVTFKCNDEDHA